MKRRRNLPGYSQPSIPVTPLIDIVFMLLIYFLLASNFISEQHFMVDIPESSHGRAGKEEIAVITVTREGFFFLDGKKVPKDLLFDRLKELYPEIFRKGLEIRAQRQAPFELVVFVLDAARGAGLSKVSVATRFKN